MAAGKIVRFKDYEKRSREPDAVADRNPADSDCIVIILPIIRIERYPEPIGRKSR